MNSGINKNWRATTARMAVCLTLLAAVQIGGADMAMAQGAGDLGGAFGPIEAVFRAIVEFINGPFGRLLATIAVIGLGFLAFAGRLSWFFAGSVILGIGLVFGAPSIVEQLVSTVGN